MRSTLPLSTFLLAASAVSFLFTAPAIAEDAEGKGRPGWARGGDGQGMGWGRRGGDGRRGFMARFAVIDNNDDGRISDDEAAAHRESVFLAMDSDDDGELTEEEYMAIRMGGGEGRNKERMKSQQEAKLARFKPMDTDGSGKVSKSEWMITGKRDSSPQTRIRMAL